MTTPSTPTAKGFLGRWGLSRSSTPVAASAPVSGSATPTGNGNALDGLEEGPVEELIVSGTAFGMCGCLDRLAWCVLTLADGRLFWGFWMWIAAVDVDQVTECLTLCYHCCLRRSSAYISRPDTRWKKLKLTSLFHTVFIGERRSVVGFFGFNHDRKLALRCLSVSAAKKDVTAVFSGCVLPSVIPPPPDICSITRFPLRRPRYLRADYIYDLDGNRLTLMSYYGVVLLMSGYQANEKWIMEQYEIIVDKCVFASSLVSLSLFPRLSFLAFFGRTSWHAVSPFLFIHRPCRVHVCVCVRLRTLLITCQRSTREIGVSALWRGLCGVQGVY